MSLDDEFYGYEEIAKRILFEIGALACCDAHDDYIYSTGMTDDDIYAFATKTLQRSESRQLYPNMKMFHDAIKSNIDNYGGNCSPDCPYCE